MSALARSRREAAYWARRVIGTATPTGIAAERIAAEIGAIVSGSGGYPALAENAQRILFVPGNGLNPSALGVEALFEMALRVRGHECDALLCDMGLASCEFNIWGPGQPPAGRYSRAISPWANRVVCTSCVNQAHRILQAAQVPVHSLRTFGAPGDIARLEHIAGSVPAPELRGFVHDGIAVGDHAFASTLRITLRGEVDLEDPEELWTLRRQLLSSMMMAERFGRALDTLKPDKVVAVHGVYLVHGTLTDVCRQRGVPVDIWGAPYRSGTVMFSHGETYHRSLMTEPNETWEGLTLNTAQERELQDYIDSKVGGGRDHVNYHPNPITERDAVVKSIGLDPNLPIVSMYTNVIWDAQIYYQMNAFRDIFDWVHSTIEYFGRRHDVQLVVRIHPAETKGGFVTRQKLEPAIRSRFPQLPRGVFIVPPESDVGSYTLAEASCAALIYGTKMGMEIAVRGIPVVVAGETMNRRKGFTYDVENREEYFALLNRIPSLPRNSLDMIARARKFIYYFYFQRMLDMPLLRSSFWSASAGSDGNFYTFRTLAALASGRSDNLDTVCGGILEGTPFIAK